MAALYEKIKLLRGLLTGEIAYVGPFYVTVDVTRRCNLRCPGCRYHSTTITNFLSPGDQEVLDFSFELFKRLCDELKSMGASELILIGEGEPFLHPRLFDLVSVVKGMGFHVTLLTNGTLLDETRIQSLVESRLDILRVSLWASTPEEYERSYPGSSPGNFRRIVDGLQRLAHMKAERKSKFPTVVLHQPINRYNSQNIGEMVDLAHTTGCDTLSFSPLKTWRGQLASFALSPDEEKLLEPALSRMKRRLSSLSIKHNIDHTLLRYRIGEAVWQELPCYIAWLHARIKVDGTVLPCEPCGLPMGRLEENTFQEIWNGPAYRNFRRQALTREGLGRLGEHCDCGFCCHVEDNLRVDRIFRWVSPFCVNQRSGATGGTV
jgi:MoaA/NifB/PqqE/SkfB family radical SAM enzyme